MTEAAAVGAPLVARTRRLDADVPLAAVAGERGILWERGRSGFAARGEAVRIEVSTGAGAAAAEAVGTVLDGMEVDDEVGLPGCGPVALGALAFSPTASRALIVPEIVVGRSEDGARWVTVIGSGGTDEPVLVEGPDARPEPTRFEVSPDRDPADWCRAVAAARDELRGGAGRKVVLARSVTVTADTDFSPSHVASRLRRAYPSCILFATDGFVGASPELLVSRVGDVVRSHPMAGTAPRSADPTTDARMSAALLASTKDREEHQITIDMVHDTLLPWCSYLDEEAEPSIVAMANVQHLATMVEGRLSVPPPSVIELMAALHPTPAVCGDPREVALEMIDRLEDLDRGRYAGPVGWVDAHGNGEWAVGIRCADITARRARLYAGVGVVAESEPATELAESQVKLQAMLAAVVRP